MNWIVKPQDFPLNIYTYRSILVCSHLEEKLEHVNTGLFGSNMDCRQA